MISAPELFNVPLIGKLINDSRSLIIDEKEEQTKKERTSREIFRK